MQKIKIDAIYINDKKQDGTPLVDKNNNPYKRAVIKWEGKTASCFLGAKYGAEKEAVIKTWAQGQEVIVTIEEKTTDAGTFLNFDLPSRLDLLEERVAMLECSQGDTITATEFKTAVEVPNNSGISDEKIQDVKKGEDVAIEDLPF